MSAATKVTNVFEGMWCPLCGDPNSLIVKLDTLIVECSSCNDEVTRSEVEAMIDKWRRLFRWIDAAGTME